MKKATVIIFAMAVMVSCSKKEEATSQAAPTQAELVARGMYLVNTAMCNDCHTPKIFQENGAMHLDKARLLSGHPQGATLPEIDPKALQPGNWILFNEHFTVGVGPWGMTYARNLTPHETGIKGWSSEVFIKAMRTGKHMGLEMERPIMPPMPWENVALMTDEDLTAIHAYLMSIPAVDNYVPSPVSPDQVIVAQTAKM